MSHLPALAHPGTAARKGRCAPAGLIRNSPRQFQDAMMGPRRHLELCHAQHDVACRSACLDNTTFIRHMEDMYMSKAC